MHGSRAAAPPARRSVVAPAKATLVAVQLICTVALVAEAERARQQLLLGALKRRVGTCTVEVDDRELGRNV